MISDDEWVIRQAELLWQNLRFGELSDLPKIRTVIKNSIARGKAEQARISELEFALAESRAEAANHWARICSLLHERADLHQKVEQQAEVIREQRAQIERLKAAVNIIDLDPEQWDAFVAALDNPPQAGPRLKALMQTAAPWEHDSSDLPPTRAEEHETKLEWRLAALEPLEQYAFVVATDANDEREE